jgi:hypothetical protein
MTSAALLIALWVCVGDRAAALDFNVSALQEVWASWAMNSARRLSSADDCSVKWLGSDNKTTFEASLTLLTKIPNEHDTLAGALLNLPLTAATYTPRWCFNMRIYVCSFIWQYTPTWG